MSARIAQQIQKNMATRTTEDLLKIWEKNDRELWSIETLEVVKQLLIERGAAFSPQRRVQANNEITS